MTYSVGIYMIDKAYGGPEEGGWWYTYGSPEEEHAHHTKHFEDYDAANRYSEMLYNLIVKPLNEGRKSIDSMLSEGIYDTYIQDGDPRPFPDQVPHYE